MLSTRTRSRAHACTCVKLIKMVDIPRCPICYELIREPVVYPCQHEVCKECFEKSIETANLWCPLCRKRVSSWARRNFKNPVHRLRREEIRKELASINTDVSEALTSASLTTPVLSRQGEIQREYLSEISKFTAEWAPPAQAFQQVQKERSEEERLGEVEAQKLLLEEEAELRKRQSQLEEESQLGYEAAKRLEEEEKRTERQQLEEDERMAELLSQEFIIQQIERRERQAAEDKKFAEKLSKETELTASTSKTYHLNTTSRLKTPKRKTAVHPKCPTHSESPSVKPITFWLKPAKHTVSSPANQ